jgi:hypothetical protein
MTTLSERFPELIPPPRQVIDREADWFAAAWLNGYRRRIGRTVPVIAVVRELAAILRDDQVPAAQALLALRRAVGLLTVLAGGSPRNRDQTDRGIADIDDEVEGKRPLALEATSRPGESTRFAKAWLFDGPAEAIRTEPVIALVELLLDALITGNATSSYDSLRQAVAVLSVFAREDKNATTAGPTGSGTN